MMEGVHRDHHRRDTSKSEEESEVDVESNASYNSQTSREFLFKSRNCFVLYLFIAGWTFNCWSFFDWLENEMFVAAVFISKTRRV